MFIPDPDLDFLPIAGPGSRLAEGKCTDLLEPVDHGLLHVHGMGLHVNEPLAQGPGEIVNK
jgi:hypothetical protein